MSTERMEVRIQYSRLTAKLPSSQRLAPFYVFPVALGLFHLLGLIFTQFWSLTRGRNTKSKASNIASVERHPPVFYLTQMHRKVSGWNWRLSATETERECVYSAVSLGKVFLVTWMALLFSIIFGKCSNWAQRCREGCCFSKCNAVSGSFLMRDGQVMP